MIWSTAVERGKPCEPFSCPDKKLVWGYPQTNQFTFLEPESSPTLGSLWPLWAVLEAFWAIFALLGPFQTPIHKSFFLSTPVFLPGQTEKLSYELRRFHLVDDTFAGCQMLNHLSPSWPSSGCTDWACCTACSGNRCCGLLSTLAEHTPGLESRVSKEAKGSLGLCSAHGHICKGWVAAAYIADAAALS